MRKSREAKAGRRAFMGEADYREQAKSGEIWQLDDNVGMDFDTFKTSVHAADPPAQLSHALQALWWDAKGDWHQAHEHAQAQDDAIGAWVHAYQHRKEGDAYNAGYWYRRAGKPHATTTLDEEWAAIAQALLP